MNHCDHGHSVHGKVRLLPTSFDELHGNIICCEWHYETEMRYRREQGQTDPRAFPQWEDLKIFNPE